MTLRDRVSESDQLILNLYVTPVEAAAILDCSEIYWRQRAWKEKIPGAMKLGKQHLLPRVVIENRKKPAKKEKET